MLNKPKPSSRKGPVTFPKDVKKTLPVKQKQKEKSRKPLKSVEAEQKVQKQRNLHLRHLKS